MTASDWTRVEVPAWLWGGKPAGLFDAAGLRVKKDDGAFLIRTDESYRNSSPDLVREENLSLPGQRDRLGRLAQFQERAEVDLDYAKIQAQLDELIAKVLPAETWRTY